VAANQYFGINEEVQELIRQAQMHFLASASQKDPTAQSKQE
jgi:hypothetical protein